MDFVFISSQIKRLSRVSLLLPLPAVREVYRNAGEGTLELGQEEINPPVQNMGVASE